MSKNESIHPEFATQTVVWRSLRKPASYVKHTGTSGAIACYRCQSRNNSNRDCDDPFHTFDNHSGQIVNFLDRNCMGSRKDRYGPFPAVACVKVAGYVRKCLVVVQFLATLLQSLFLNFAYS